MKTLLDVQGMHCANCSSTVTKHLKEVDGVREATVNFATQTAIVEHAESVQTKQLLQAVKQAGYTGSLRQHRKEGKAHHQEQAVFPHVAMWSAAVLLVVSMGSMVGLPITHGPVNAIVQLVLVLVIFLNAPGVFKQGLVAAWRARSANMDTLVVLGISAAFLYSSFALGSWVVRGEFFTQRIYFGIAGLVLAFVLLGRYFEGRAKHSTRDVLSTLLSLAPQEARLVVDGRDKTIPVAEVAKGDTLKVKPGDRVPVDGVILAGNSRVDESMLTGEPNPVKKGKDDAVFAGTMNQTGMFLLRVRATGDKTALAGIVRFVEQAQSSQAPVQRVADRVASVFVPVVLGVALLTFVGWLLFPPVGEAFPVAFALSAAIAVLLIACPAALLLATPTAVMVAMGVAGSKGVLFKDAASLQKAAGVRMVAFDKMGTLTVGKPQVQFIKTYNDLSEQVVFRYAASVESGSSHPVAQAFVDFAEENQINYGDPRSFEEVEGFGVRGKVEGRKIVIGSLDFFVDEGIGLYDARERVDELAKKQLSPILVAVEGKIAAVVGIADALKESAADGVHALSDMGLETVMLTGDRQEVADVIATELGVGVVRAQLSPKQKLEEISRLRRKRSLAVVGDGVTDAPALAHADVGVAIGAATNVSLEEAEVVLVGAEVTGVSRSLYVAQRTMRVAKQNVGWALGYNVLALPLAAGVLFPFTGWLLSPVIAGAAMAVSSLSVVLNSLRLKKI